MSQGPNIEKIDKEEKFQIPAKYWILFISALCVILIVVTFNTAALDGVTDTGAGYVVIPFQEGVTAVGGALRQHAQSVKELRSLREENAALRSELDDVKSELSVLQQQSYELSRLQELYRVDQQYVSYEKTGARIIAKDPGNWYHTFLIDKGSDDGLAVDMNVIASGGLVGRITKTGPGWSRVESIINDNANVAGCVLSTQDDLMVSGDLTLYSEGMIRFSQLVASEGAVVEGDKVVTSRISDKYLPGILIGYISTTHRDYNNITRSGYLIPAVDFEHLDTVLVILRTKDIPDEEETESGK